MFTERAIDRIDPTPLHTTVIGSRILILDETTSTNDVAFRMSEDGAVVIAELQTAGRGRRGNAWHSAPGLGLWFSVALDGPVPGLSMAAALAVRDAVAPHGALTVKWPNDLLFNAKKVCGVLVEHRDGRTVVGIGLNVRHSPADFPADLAEQATSLEHETGAQIDRSILLRAMLSTLDEYVLQLRAGKIDVLRREWATACGLLEQQVRCDGSVGTVIGFDDDGTLLIATDSGLQRVCSGPVERVAGA